MSTATPNKQNSHSLKLVLPNSKRKLGNSILGQPPEGANQATSPEVKELRSEALALKECAADLTLENRLLKKSMTGLGEDLE